MLKAEIYVSRHISQIESVGPPNKQGWLGCDGRSNAKHSLVVEDVVLRAHAQGGPDLVHLRPDVPSVDEGRARGGGVEAGQDGPGEGRNP